MSETGMAGKTAGDSESKTLPERMVDFYTAMGTPSEREEALKTMDQLYAEDVVSFTPAEWTYGLDSLKESWSSVGRYAAFYFAKFTCIEDGDEFVLFYTMSINVGVGQTASTSTCTRFRVRTCQRDEVPKVCWQEDIWDTAGALANVTDETRELYESLVAKLLRGGPSYQCDPKLDLGWKREDGCFHPKDEVQLAALVKDTKLRGGTLRVAGSGHSVWSAIAPDDFEIGPTAKNRSVILDGLQKVTIDEAAKTVEVGAGCYLGKSPCIPVRNVIEDPDKLRAIQTANVTLYHPPSDNGPTPGSWNASLLKQLDDAGLALPDLGGITHQSVGGFLSTGSSGGTTQHSLGENILALDLMDASGEVHHVTKESNPELFDAAGVSMGLCGIVTSVKLQCCEKFYVFGKQVTYPADAHPGVNFYSVDSDTYQRRRKALQDERRKANEPIPPDIETPPDLATFLTETEYTRMMWWPQHDFDRLVVWQAQQTQKKPEKIRPYEEMGVGMPSVLMQMGGSLLLSLLSYLDDANLSDPKLQELSRRALGFLAQPNEQTAKELEEAAAGGPLERWVTDELDKLPPGAAKDHLEPLISRIETDLNGNDSALLASGFDGPQFLASKSSFLEKLEALLARSQKNQTAGASPLGELLGLLLDQSAVPILEWLVKVLRLPDGLVSPEAIKKLVIANLARLLGVFVSDTSEKDIASYEKEPLFYDHWYNGLPMDNGMDDVLMPTWFTEIWIPFGENGRNVKATVDALQKYFRPKGGKDEAAESYARTGFFCTELYAAKAGGEDGFYLDAAYGDEPVFRVDVFWFARGTQSPQETFYPGIWNALTEVEPALDVRFHWGKFKPDPKRADAQPEHAAALRKLREAFTRGDRLKHFDDQRKKMDANGVFLTDYWKNLLEL